jgi:hypothetical protein
VYSPQYGLWLLPLFALVLPNPWAFAAFSITDLAMFLTRFRFFGTVEHHSWGWPQWWFEAAVLARAAVLVWCLVLWVRRRSEPVPGEIDASGELASAEPIPDPPGPGADGSGEPATRASPRLLADPFRRPSLAALAVVASLTLTGGYVLKARCLDQPWDGRQWTTDCYNDIQVVYSLRGIADDRSFPPRDLEYPAGTVFYVGAAAQLTRSARGFFQANAVGILATGIATTVLLGAMAPSRSRVLLFAIGPPLFLYAFQNWDVLAVALTIAGLSAAVRRRYGLAGAAVGLGAAVKLFPLLALPAVLLVALREERPARPALGRALAGFGSVLVAVNALLFAISPESWRVFWTFQTDRFPNPETSWFMVARHLEGMFPSPAWSASYVRFANAASLALLAAVGLVACWAFLRRRDRPAFALAFVLFAAAMLTSKVFSPQYMLWLLPFFALLAFPWYAYVAYVFADVAVLVSVNGYFTTIAVGGDWPHSLAILEVFTWLRYAVLLWLVFLALRLRDPPVVAADPVGTAAVARRSPSRLLHSEPGSG